MERVDLKRCLFMSRDEILDPNMAASEEKLFIFWTIFQLWQRRKHDVLTQKCALLWSRSEAWNEGVVEPRTSNRSPIKPRESTGRPMSTRLWPLRDGERLSPFAFGYLVDVDVWNFCHRSWALTADSVVTCDLWTEVVCLQFMATATQSACNRSIDIVMAQPHDL